MRDEPPGMWLLFTRQLSLCKGARYSHAAIPATASRTLLETFLARAEEAAIQESYRRVDAQIVSMADVPNAPSYPRPALMIVARRECRGAARPCGARTG
jgi:hypothetical protein